MCKHSSSNLPCIFDGMRESSLWWLFADPYLIKIVKFNHSSNYLNKTKMISILVLNMFTCKQGRFIHLLCTLIFNEMSTYLIYAWIFILSSSFFHFFYEMTTNLYFLLIVHFLSGIPLSAKFFIRLSFMVWYFTQCLKHVVFFYSSFLMKRMIWFFKMVFLGSNLVFWVP